MIAHFDDVFPNPVMIDLSEIKWVTKKMSSERFEITFAYPIQNLPKQGDFVYIYENEDEIFSGYALDIQEKELTIVRFWRMTNA